MTDAQAAWFIFNALGFVPDANNRFRLVRPLFNVATLQLPRTRRLIIHTKIIRHATATSNRRL